MHSVTYRNTRTLSAKNGTEQFSTVFGRQLFCATFGTVNLYANNGIKWAIEIVPKMAHEHSSEKGEVKAEKR